MKGGRYFWIGLLGGTTLGMGLGTPQMIPGGVGVGLAQPPTLNSPEAKSKEAFSVYQEGMTLLRQGTATSLAQVLEKLELALTLAREAGNRQLEALILQGVGTVYFAQNDYQQAIALQERSLAIHRELNNRVGEGTLLSAIAMSYFNLGNKQKALELYNQALTVLRAENHTDLEAPILINMGDLYVSLGETAKGLEIYRQALAIHQSRQDVVGQARTLATIGRVQLELGEQQQALDAFKQALSFHRQGNNLNGEVQTLMLLGTLYSTLGDNQQAQESYQRGLEILEKLATDPSGVGPFALNSSKALVLSGLATTTEALGDPQQALGYFEQAIALARSTGNPHQVAETLNGVSFFYRRQGEVQQAIAALQEALAIQKEIGVAARQAFTLANLGETYLSIGEPQEALDAYQQALALQRSLGEPSQEANTLSSLAYTYQTLGDYQSSIDVYTQALALARQVDNRTIEGQVLNNLGDVYRTSDDYTQAVSYHQQALKIWRSQENYLNTFAAMTGLIRDYEDSGNYAQALSIAKEAQSLARQQESPFQEGISFSFIGRINLATEEYSQAIEALQKGLPLLQKSGFRLPEAALLEHLGRAYLGLKQYDRAIEAYRNGLAIYHSLGDRVGEASLLYSLAEVERDRGNLTAALTEIESALQIVESLRTKLVSSDLRTTYFSSIQEYYEFYIDLLMSLHQKTPTAGHDAKALQARERARARSLLDLLIEARADIRQGIDPQLQAQEQALQQKLSALEERRQTLLDQPQQSTQLEQLQQEINRLLTQYQMLQTQIRQESPRYAALTQPQPLTLSEIQQQVLDDQTLLLEYALGKDRSYLWVVSKTDLKSYTLPKRDEIEAIARQFYQQIKTPDSGNMGLSAFGKPSVSDAGTQLSQALLQPITPLLGQNRLLIVGDGVLQYIPFAALPSPIAASSTQNPRPLIADHEIVMLPSASTLAVNRRQLKGRPLAPKTVAMVADPVFSVTDQRVKDQGKPTPPEPLDRSGRAVQSKQIERSARKFGVTWTRLPGTRAEAEAIMTLVPPSEQTHAFDFEANLQRIIQGDLTQYRFVHLATHGFANSVNPELSGVVLSLVDQNGNPQAGYLRLNDIFNLDLPAELAVLSACQTGLGQDVRGEGLIGLSRGFMYAGAKRVVVSLWSVDDASTKELMVLFYRKMLQENLSPAAALRAAQIEMWQTPKWQDPFYWAAFTLQGEW